MEKRPDRSASSLSETSEVAISPAAEKETNVRHSQGFPRVLRGFNREEPFPRLANSKSSNSSVSDTTEKMDNGTDDQDENTAHSYNDKIYSEDSNSEGSFSLYLERTLNVESELADTEFPADALRLFEYPLLSAIGWPTILAYKQESRDKVLDPRLFAFQVPETECTQVLCEFCGQKLKPFPSHNQIQNSSIDEFFCCDQYQILWEFLSRERITILEKKRSEKISVDPHPPFGDQEEREKVKQRAAQRLREREMEKYYQAEDTSGNYSNNSKQFRTISYQLSRCAPKDGNWTLIPKDETEEIIQNEEGGSNEEENEFFMNVGDFTMVPYKDKKLPFTEKYYTNGNKFLTLFSDGTAQVFYPSGNLAVLVTLSCTREFVCLVLEDKANDAAIQAVFDSQGKGTCYYPNGVVWLNINIHGGMYLNENGKKVKHWWWNESTSLSNSAPLKPIFLSLNNHTGVRILGQDKIFISFLAMGKQIKFNVGTKMQLKDQRTQPTVKSQITTDDLLLLASRIKAEKTLFKMYMLLTFPVNNQLEKIHLPQYLTSLSKKLLSLCETFKLEKHEQSFINASLEGCL
ncbi:glutamate-rich protein 6-like [Erpetoichthys calabaricus]|uniref:glutamate-rich protein 6-like n=1 Tax=Erpetoichthys calabaricus TaxID=27687 RepID=UPI0022340C92|nr:glutamate-rich protein 6-like [Erpetoichthys calabaricus]